MQTWYKDGQGMRRCKGLGRVQSSVVGRSPVTGRGQTVWLAYTETGVRIGGYHPSDRAAQAALENAARYATPAQGA